MLLNYFFTNQPSRKLQMDVRYMMKFKNSFRLLRRFFERRIFYKYNCEISYQADIHESIKFGHPVGIVIGSNVTIKEGCTIYQNVTIGANFMKDNSMPFLSENVIVGAGAKVIGGIVIGKGVVIGANAVVTKDIPEYKIVTCVNEIRDISS